MLKIIHLDTGEDLRGGQHQLLMLARGLEERGHQQLVVTLEGTALEARAHQEGFRVFALPRHDPAGAHGIMQVRQLLRTEPFQILHAHDGRGQTISWLASMGMNVARVASRRVTYSPPRRIDTRLKYGRTCDAVIAVSKYVGQLLIDAGVPASHIEVIYDGVELPDEVPEATAGDPVRMVWQYKAHDFLVGHISTATDEKGLDVAEAAARQLQKSMSDVQIAIAIAHPNPPDNSSGVIVPVQPPVEPVRDYQGNYREIGCPSDLSKFFAALDLYIMPSRAEGLGSSAIMAMAHGVPVVASRVGGLPEIVEEGETGWLVPPGSPEALADAIADAASNRDRLREMGPKARQRAEQFSSTLMVERTESLYKRLAGEKFKADN
jgi:glycosyltransferase involved in cell wall biosynthesis